jgi:hypothetical protein
MYICRIERVRDHLLSCVNVFVLDKPATHFSLRSFLLEVTMKAVRIHQYGDVVRGFDKTSKAFFLALRIAIRAFGFCYLQSLMSLSRRYSACNLSVNYEAKDDNGRSQLGR